MTAFNSLDLIVSPIEYVITKGGTFLSTKWMTMVEFLLCVEYTNHMLDRCTRILTF